MKQAINKYAGVMARPRSGSSSNRGSAMIVVIAAVAVVGVMMITMLSAAVDSSEWTEREVESYQVEAAAETVVAMVASDLWTGFERSTSGTGGLAGFSSYLNTRGVTAQTGTQTNSSAETREMNKAAIEVGNTQNTAYQSGDFRSQVSIPTNDRGEFVVDGVRVDSLIVRREDAFETVRLFIECTTSNGLASKDDESSRFRVQHVYEVGAAEWEGTEFALLSNNVNCILCHTSVDNAERFYNDDPTLFGTFDRVRLGSIETFHVREDPESDIAGALYLGGDAVLGDGSPITDWNALSLNSASFDNHGSLSQDAWGGLQMGSMSPASALTPSPMENLYLDYLAAGPEGQVDGVLPSNFPSPFPDNGGLDMATGSPTPEFGGNRKVDDNEFAATTAGSNGSISGGNISVMTKNSKGRVRNSRALKDMQAGNSASLAGQTDANVYLHGTEADPIILNGSVAIDGDLIISGYVKGAGSLRVSGNVYMPSDVKYLDGVNSRGNRTYGVAADGTQNNMAVASGGNVVIGDYYRPAWGSGKNTNGWGSGSFNFIMEEMATFNRMEWMKTQATLPGEAEYVMTGVNEWDEVKKKYKKEYYKVDQMQYKWVKTGKKIKKTKYKYINQSNGKPAPYTAFTRKKVVDYHYWVDEKVKVENGMKKVTKHRWVETGETYIKEHRDEIWEWQTPQYENPYYQGANYMARYYSFTKNSYAPIPNKQGFFDPSTSLWMADEMQGGWSSSKMDYPRESQKSNPYLYNEDGSPKAAVISVTPENNWIDTNRMVKMYRDAVKDRDDKADMEIDATIYSSNSIFGVVPDDKKTNTNGRLQVNGLIVAADVGLLAPKGTQINYDPRGREMMDIQSDSQLEIRRHLRTPLP